MKKYKIFSMLIAVAIIASILLYIDYAIFKIAFIIVMSIILGLLVLKELVIILPFFASYMLNVQTKNFDKRIQKPRLLFYLLFGSLALISLVNFYNIKNTNSFYQFASITQILLFTLSAYLLFFSWTNAFSYDLIPKMQKKIFVKSNYFEIGWSENQLKEIFNNLHDNNFIEILVEYDSFEDTFFSEIFLTGEIPQNQPLKLLMDNIQTKYFYDLFSSKSVGFTLDNFLCIFSNKNGEVNRSTVEPSFSKSKKNPKKSEVLDSVFQFKSNH